MARALYIHWPFCLKKCPYCDFNSHVREAIDHERWRQAMLADMRNESGLAGGETLTSIFFGGGTPSLMPPELVGTLLDEAERLWGFAPDIEITLEANPTSFEAARFAGFRASGVNRVSIGVQSLRDDALSFLGREHSVDVAKRTVAMAQDLFGRVTFDLIYARPGQTEPAWEAELTEALAFGTDHISLYQLTIEPGTRFATDVRRGTFDPLKDDPAADLYDLTQRMTQAAGLMAYETSNHARVGQESRHNLTYWRYQDYCGIGPGAHGRRGGVATMRHKKPENWLQAVDTQGQGLSEERALCQGEAASEALLMGLRLAEGIDLATLSDRFGVAQPELVDEARVARFEKLGFLWRDGDRLGVAPPGRPLLDALLGEIVAGELVAS